MATPGRPERAWDWGAAGSVFVAGVAAFAATLIVTLDAGAAESRRDLRPFENSSGKLRTVSTTGSIDRDNPFFQSSLGTNGQSCATCHQPDQAWSITPEFARARFEATDGLDPLFRLVDTANAPNADVSTVAARRAAYSLMLAKGLVRIVRPIPPNAEFELIAVDDPYGFAHAGALSLFRRPLPTTNFKFLSAVNWDGRSNAISLELQACRVINGLMQGSCDVNTADSNPQMKQIVAFQKSIFTAQEFDNLAGPLQARGTRGGPRFLPGQEFFLGINDPLGQNPTGAPFDKEAFTLFRDWADLGGATRKKRNAARLAIARGEQLFNGKPIAITGVGGINDNAELGRPAVVNGFCTTCHDTPNVGNHSLPHPPGGLNIGLSDESRRTPDLPLYTLRNKSTGEIVRTTDPGSALNQGKWADIGKFKGPILRGLAARAPYFHNGSAATLGDAVDFYDDRFDIGLTAREKSDLVAFLRSL